ncbi:MAG TPA: hypothetical protein DDY20_09205 [Desulfobulbaceae bacterium]|nr:hypothetical protein [Desulfobulbaceae bacterium]
MNRPVLNNRNDLAGNSVLRVFRHQLLARFLPLGNYRGGAGLKCLVIFSVLHYVGRPLFRVLVRFERQLHCLYKLRERFSRKEDNKDSEEQGE